MIGFVTGSDGDEVGLKKGLGDLDEAHAGLVFKGGLARVAMAPPPPLTSPPDVMQDWADATGLLSFVMYALDREDWMAEYIEYEEAMKDAILDAVDKAHYDRLRSKFTVIEGGGGATTETPEDEG